MQTAISWNNADINGGCMNDPSFRKDFGERLRGLRKQKRWSQKELANRVEIRFEQLNKYECGLNMPLAQTLMRLADVLSTSVDFLLSGDPAQKLPATDTRFVTRFQAMMELDADEQEAVIKVIDAMIAKSRIARAITPVVD